MVVARPRLNRSPDVSAKELCWDCPRRSFCRVLCPDAERYVRQDHVGRDELPLGLVQHGSFPVGSSLYLTDREREILIMLGRGLGRADICELLNISRPNLRKIIERIRKKAGGGELRRGGEIPYRVNRGNLQS